MALNVRLQIISDDEVVDELEAKGILGVVITEKDRSFALGGKVSIEDVIVSKHIFEKGADEYVAANT